ncbi:MAG: conjugal transfer protein TrbH, partial [Hyphomicrobiales bacterium]
MRAAIFPIIFAIALAGCQATDEALTTDSTPAAVSGPAASAIAGDMASRLAEQMGPVAKVPIKMDKDSSAFSTALEAALKGWGFAVITDGKVDKSIKPIELAYSIDSSDGQILARLWTPSIAISRVYAPT